MEVYICGLRGFARNPLTNLWSGNPRQLDALALNQRCIEPTQDPFLTLRCCLSEMTCETFYLNREFARLYVT
ncbi:unnamed protein product [Arctogadus glacialis]